MFSKCSRQTFSTSQITVKLINKTELTILVDLIGCQFKFSSNFQKADLSSQKRCDDENFTNSEIICFSLSKNHNRAIGLGWCKSDTKITQKIFFTNQQLQQHIYCDISCQSFQSSERQHATLIHTHPHKYLMAFSVINKN